jgi:hypothetical protein
MVLIQHDWRNPCETNEWPSENENIPTRTTPLTFLLALQPCGEPVRPSKDGIADTLPFILSLGDFSRRPQKVEPFLSKCAVKRYGLIYCVSENRRMGEQRGHRSLQFSSNHRQKEKHKLPLHHHIIPDPLIRTFVKQTYPRIDVFVFRRFQKALDDRFNEWALVVDDI